MTRQDLRTTRKRLGYSQAALAYMLRVDVMTVSRWERGVREIPPYMHLLMDHMRCLNRRAARRNKRGT